MATLILEQKDQDVFFSFEANFSGYHQTVSHDFRKKYPIENGLSQLLYDFILDGEKQIAKLIRKALVNGVENDLVKSEAELSDWYRELLDNGIMEIPKMESCLTKPKFG